MTNEEAKKLCLDLIHADSEEDVVAILRTRDLWEDANLWRYYGDVELNWDRAGNQQARTDFAINEKLVNTIDSRLMLECMLAGISPDGPSAPQTMREAVNRFIEKTWTGTLKVSGGRVEEWPPTMRTKVAENIAVFTTGQKGRKPCVNVADLGEGQTPEAFPLTMMSLGKLNKIRINFAQGKYGQGATGAVRCCGTRKLQLVVSRRYPGLIGNKAAPSTYPIHESDLKWGFTVVRREGEGMKIKAPFLSYLAPLQASTKPRQGGVLRFTADTMPLFPKGDEAYEREVEHGTLVKMYEYDLKTTSNILRRGGLRPKIDLLLPEPALPIRFHECREAQKTGSEQVETMSGLFARLANNKNVVNLSPPAVPITVKGHDLIARVFAFEPKSSDTYRSNEGVIFTINGQAQGYLKASFFARKRVGLQRLAKDLLVVLDCSTLGPIEQNDMFMPSRDRLVDDNPFAMEVERQLEIALHDHPGLRELKNARAKLDVDEQIADNKPFEDVLKRVFKNSPSLVRFFGTGQRLSNPFKPETKQPTTKPFEGKTHPTYFRHAGKEQGALNVRPAHIGQRVRITYETDAVDEYLTRKVDRGEKTLVRIVDGKRIQVDNYAGPNLSEGRGSITFDLPETSSIGNVLEIEFTVRDPVTGSEFVNTSKLTVLAAAEDKPGAKPAPKIKPDEPPAPQGPQGPSGVELPEVVWIKHGANNWDDHFSEPDDCLDIIDDGDDGKPVWKFYLNEDNRALQSDLKFTKLPPQAVRKQFEIGVVLIGMALIHDAKERPTDGSEDGDELQKRVREYTRAIAPIVLPMIQSLGDLANDELDLSDQVGEAA